MNTKDLMTAWNNAVENNNEALAVTTDVSAGGPGAEWVNRSASTLLVGCAVGGIDAIVDNAGSW